MKILVLVPALHNTSPGLRFRVEQWAHYLEPEGFQFHFAPFEDNALHQVIYQQGRYPLKALLTLRALGRRFSWLPRIRNYDLIILHREAALLGPAILEWLIVQRGVPLIYDFDDPIWISYKSPTNGILSYFKFPGKTASICKLATLVTVGNRLLAGWAQQHNRHVEIVPSTVDLVRYPQKTYFPPTPFTLCWTGSHSTLPFLDTLVPTLRRFAERRSYRLLVISHTDSYRIDGLPATILSRRWRADSEAKDLLQASVGLAPFPNTGWTPWRCHGKVLQYMAIGIPTIASPVGILSDYIQDGKNGYLASSEEEWLQRLEQLADDQELGSRLGMAGRDTIEQHYSAQVWVPRVKTLLERVTSASSSRNKV